MESLIVVLWSPLHSITRVRRPTECTQTAFVTSAPDHGRGLRHKTHVCQVVAGQSAPGVTGPALAVSWDAPRQADDYMPSVLITGLSVGGKCEEASRGR